MSIEAHIRERIFPREFFHEPPKKADGSPDWNFMEEPLNKKLLEQEMQTQDSLRKAISNNLTEEFFTSLYYKVARKPPENITIEIKGETRSGKSSVGIFLSKLISHWWNKEFTVNNIMANQGELLYKLKDAEFGSTWLVDEQTPEDVGEGAYTQAGSLLKCLNIGAKKCLNMIFIYPPRFVMRNAPFGLEIIAKDTTSRYIKVWFHDLRRKNYGYGGIWPHGFVYIPKYIDRHYQESSAKSPFRKMNLKERGSDFDSQLEEDYEQKKDAWIEDIVSLDAGVRNKKKEEISEMLADDPVFLKQKNSALREAYLQMLINRGKVMELARTEFATVVNMAKILSENDIE
jgi:hypothetical protein